MRSATTSFYLSAGAILAAMLAPTVHAHGACQSVIGGGKTVECPNVYYDGAAENKETVARKGFRADGKAYALPSDFASADTMSCAGASGAPKSLSVNAGDSVTIVWDGATKELLGQGGRSDASHPPWVHAMGPVTDYIADCGGDCAQASPGALGWSKLATYGLDTSQQISSSLRAAMAAKPEPYNGNGLWGLAKLIQDGSKWTVNVPKDLKPGNYMIRNELAAVHSPKAPQIYIACVQLKVGGSGTKSLPAGVTANKFYSTSGSLATYDVYSHPQSYTDDGPAILKLSDDSSAPAPTTSQAPATTSKASTAAPAPTSEKPATTQKPATTSTQQPAPTSAKTSTAPTASATKKCVRKKKRSIAAAAAAAAQAQSVREARAARVHRRAASPHGDF